jgi:hypothetical protein
MYFVTGYSQYTIICKKDAEHTPLRNYACSQQIEGIEPLLGQARHLAMPRLASGAQLRPVPHRCLRARRPRVHRPQVGMTQQFRHARPPLRPLLQAFPHRVHQQGIQIRQLFKLHRQVQVGDAGDLGQPAARHRGKRQPPEDRLIEDNTQSPHVGFGGDANAADLAHRLAVHDAVFDDIAGEGLRRHVVAGAGHELAQHGVRARLQFHGEAKVDDLEIGRRDFFRKFLVLFRCKLALFKTT